MLCITTLGLHRDGKGKGWGWSRAQLPRLLPAVSQTATQPPGWRRSLVKDSACFLCSGMGVSMGSKFFHGVCPPAWVFHGPQLLWEGSTMEHLPSPLTLALSLSFPPPQHFVPFLKCVSLEIPLMGLAVPWGGFFGELSGRSCLAQGNPSHPATTPQSTAWH